MPPDSDTPLVRKLGIKPAARILFVNAPAKFAATLGPLPADVELLRADVDELVELVTCSPKTGPGGMRVSEAPRGRETNHEATHG
jgi:hypothetical protein